MGLSEIPVGYMPQSADGLVSSLDSAKEKLANKKKIHILKKIKKRFFLVRRSPSSCAGPNNLPPLQFHTVHGDNIRISRDGTLARRFESFCRAITFSARPVRINERICVKFAETSNNWNGGIRFGFTNNDPAGLENELPKYACPDLTNRPGFWAKALHEQYCEKDNILYYYVNAAGDVVYGINNEEKGVILSGIDTRGLLWTLIDIYGNCTAIEFLDARIYMYQPGNGIGAGGSMSTLPAITGGGGGSGGGSMTNHHHHNQHHQHHQQPSRRSLPVSSSSHATTSTSEQELLERHVLPSMQSLNISADNTVLVSNDMANGLPPLRYNAQGRLIPVPFHITKGRNVRLSHDRFIASRTEGEFCQGYVFTARPIRIGEKVIVQVLKTEHMYVGALALGLTSCNPASLQPGDLPNDSDYLLDRPEYWVVSKDIASAPQRADEIAFFIAPNGEVSISKNNGPAVVVMHVDQSLQLWAFLDVYGSTQSVRMFRQQLPNMVAGGSAVGNSYPHYLMGAASASSSSARLMGGGSSMPMMESMNSLNSQISEAASKSSLLLHPSQLNIAHTSSGSNFTSSSSTLGSINNVVVTQTATTTPGGGQNASGGAASVSATNGGGRMISVPSAGGDILQIQPNVGGTVLVVNLPPATSSHDINGSVNGGGSSVTARLNAATSVGLLTGTSNASFSECGMTNGQRWTTNSGKDLVDHHHHSAATKDTAAGNSPSAGSAECTICYENQIDSVLYMCGHMCMCYDCAIEQWRGVGGGQCPLCRAVIRDVIRTYTT